MLPRDLPDPAIKPTSLISPALAGMFFTTSITWEAHLTGRETQEGGDVCIHMAESRCCTAGTNITLESNYTPIKFFN